MGKGFDVDAAIAASEYAEGASIVAPKGVRAGLLGRSVQWHGYNLGPMTLAHVLGLMELGNCVGLAPRGMMTEKTGPALLRDELEAFYALTLPGAEFLDLVRTGLFGERVEEFLLTTGAGIITAGFDDAVAHAIAESMVSYVGMGASGGGKPGKLRGTGGCWRWLMCLLRGGGALWRRLWQRPSAGGGSV